MIDFLNQRPQKNSGNCRRINIAQNLDILAEFKANGRNKTAIKYGISESTLTYWKQQENDLRNANYKYKKITLSLGRKPKYSEIEENLVNFIEFNPKLLNPITSYSIAQKMYELVPQLKDKKYKSIFNWIYRFLERHHYSFRRSTHVGQLFPNNPFEISSIFHLTYIKVDMNYTYDLIGNMDETPININMPPNYSVAKKGKKNIIIIRTQGQEKCRVSLLLTILANGKKLNPFSYI